MIVIYTLKGVRYHNTGITPHIPIGAIVQTLRVSPLIAPIEFPIKFSPPVAVLAVLKVVGLR